MVARKVVLGANLVFARRLWSIAGDPPTASTKETIATGIARSEDTTLTAPATNSATTTPKTCPPVTAAPNPNAENARLICERPNARLPWPCGHQLHPLGGLALLARIISLLQVQDDLENTTHARAKLIGC